MEHLVVSLGAMMAAAAFLAVVLKFLKQSSIVAFIAVGVVAALFDDAIHIPHQLFEAFTEIGIILLLFMAGMEVDLKSFAKRWKQIIFNGLGQIVINTGLGILFGALVLGLDRPVEFVFFGLCLTFSSTIIVIGLLKARKDMETLHGQIILGLMVLQDICAVIAVSVLKGMTTGGPMLPAIGFLFLKLIGAVVVAFLLSRFVLKHVFRFFAKSEEILFVGTLGYALGFAAVCELVHFSPEIGVFVAGASIGVLPYKIEIESKVEPLKNFGVILFFIALGHKLEFGAESLGYIVPVVITVAAVVFVTPLLMISLGWISRLKARPAFYIGAIINQISEFSLILATLCLQAGIFSKRSFMIITLSCVGTILISSLGHQFLQALFRLFQRPLSFVERRSKVARFEGAEELVMEDHIVLLGYNELTAQIAEILAARKMRALLIDLDPDVFEHVRALEGSLVPAYADIYNPEVWKEFRFDKASMVISFLIGDQEAELTVCRYIKERNPSVSFIAATDSSAEAIELYGAGATYVIQTEELAARQFRQIFAEEMEKGEAAFEEHRRAHVEDLERLKEASSKLFYAV